MAVSGAGNLYFNPLLADSGYVGSVGAYGLSITASAVGGASGPAFVSADAGIPGLAPVQLSANQQNNPS